MTDQNLVIEHPSWAKGWAPEELVNMQTSMKVFLMTEENRDITLEEATAGFEGREKGWAETAWNYHIAHPRDEHDITPDWPPHYPSMDPEVRELCRVINDVFPGIRTTDSCCGHGRQPFMIWLKVDEGEHRGLFMLARCADRRYWKYGHEWKLEIEVSDVPTNPLPICYVLSSKDKGENAYEQAEDLLRNIEWHRKHVNFLEGYGLEELALPGTFEA